MRRLAFGVLTLNVTYYAFGDVISSILSLLFLYGIF